MPYSSSYRASFFATCFFGVLVQICHTQTIEKIVPVTPAPRPSPEGKHKSRGPLTKSSEDPAFGFEFTGIGEGPPPNATNSDPETIKHKYKHCMVKYLPSTCRESNLCETKRLCVQVIGDPCCGPADGECPIPLQLGVRCLKAKPVNWCYHSKDCTKGALCCDTGCGYNICVGKHEL